MCSIYADICKINKLSLKIASQFLELYELCSRVVEKSIFVSAYTEKLYTICEKILTKLNIGMPTVKTL